MVFWILLAAKDIDDADTGAFVSYLPFLFI